MKTCKIAILSAFFLAGSAYGGGTIGGTGPSVSEGLAGLFSSPDILRGKIEVSPGLYRRTRARLAVSETAPMLLDTPAARIYVPTNEIKVKLLSGAIVEHSEAFQIVAEPETESIEASQ
jgi:hypothetical protein